MTDPFAPVPVVQVTTVYGDKYYVNPAHLASARTQIPMYTKDGLKLSLTQKGESMQRRGKCLSIHRDNITGQANAHFNDYHTAMADKRAAEIDAENVAAFEVQMQQASGKLFV